MFTQLTLEEFKKFAKTDSRIAVYQEIPGDQLTPINAYRALEGLTQYATLLESSPKEKSAGRFSYLCFDPYAKIESYGKDVAVTVNHQTKNFQSDPFEILRKYQKQYRAKTIHPLSGFVGGMVGFTSYDAIRLIETIPDSNAADFNVPDLLFRFYRSNIAFDFETGKVVVTTLAVVEGDVEEAYDKAIKQIKMIVDRLSVSHESTDDLLTRMTENNINEDASVDVSDEMYKEIISKAKQYIVDGDIFQVVPSRCFRKVCQADPFDVYRALRFCSPSPYMFYIDNDEFVITGASPEKLVSVKDGVVESRPLAGTRAKKSAGEDEAIAEDLLKDEKEVAEHTMLVDLARNDVGAVCVPGSVEVTKLKEVTQFSHVMHISSTVQGKLAPEKDAFDALKAAFPAGTLSGAPKIRAMEIIDELESSRRGVYSGAICAVDSQGDLDSCIAIRMAVIHEGVATVRAGGGIVFDSNPQAEADETRQKAQSVLQAISLAEGGVS